MWGKLSEAIGYATNTLNSAVSTISPYASSAFKVLTTILGVQGATMPESSRSSYQNYTDGTGLVTYNFNQNITNFLSTTPLPLAESRHLRGSYHSIIEDQTEHSSSTTVATSWARKLTWLTCSPAPGSNAAVLLPDSDSYYENQIYYYNFSTFSLPDNSYRALVTINLISPVADLRIGNVSYASSIIEARVPFYLQVVPNSHYNGPILLSMTGYLWSPTIPALCTVGQTSSFIGVNKWDNLAFPVNFTSTAAYVNSPSLFPIPLPTNYDSVSITYSLAGANLTAGWASIIPGASDGSGAYVLLNARPGFQIEPRNLTIIANGANPPNPAPGDYPAYQANMTLTVITPSRGPAVIGAISCPPGTVGQNVTCIIDPATIFGGPDGYGSISNIAIENQPIGASYYNGTLRVPVDKTSANPIQFNLLATDVVGLQARAPVFISTAPSLSYIAPTASLSVDENTQAGNSTSVILPNYNISTPSLSNTTITYILASTLMGNLAANAVGFTSAFNRVTGTLILKGKPIALNNAQVRYNPAQFYSGAFSYSVYIDDGLNNVVGPLTTQGNVDFVYVPLSAGTSLSNTTLTINQQNLFSLPGNAVFNPHLLTLRYSASLAGGAELPDWIECNPATGSITANPIAGNQGNYALVIRAEDVDNASNYVDLSLNMLVPEHAPIVANPLSSQTLAKGMLFSFTLPANTFSDADGAADIVNITASGLLPGMSFNNTTHTLSWLPGADSPSSVQISFIATDTQGQQATAILPLSIQSSLSLTAPNAQALLENTGSNSIQFINRPTINTPSSNNGTIIYTLNDASAGSFAVNATAGVSIQNQGWQVTLNGRFQSIKEMPIAFIPTKYRRVGVAMTVTIDDGLNLPQSINLQQSIQESYVPLSAGTALPSVTAVIGQVTQFSLAASAYNNPHSVAVTYSLVASNGTVPAWVQIDSNTGAVSFNPSAGNQGAYQNLSIRVQEINQVSNYIDLPLSLTVAQHAPIVANPLSSQTIQRGNLFSFSLPASTFSDADGAADIVNISVSGLLPGMSFNNSTHTLSWLPGADSPSSTQISFIATDTQGQQATAVMSLAIQSSLSLIASNAQTLLENTGSNSVQMISRPTINTPSSNNGTITYTLNDASAGNFVVNAATGVQVQNQGWQVSLTGPFQSIKDIAIGFMPTQFRRIGVAMIATIDDGLNVPQSINLQQSIQEQFVPLSAGTTLSNTIAFIGIETQVSLPGSAVANFHNVPLTYSLRYNNSSDVPAWAAIDAVTGAVNLNPPVGAQGAYSFSIRAQDQSNPSNYIDLPFTATVPNRSPVIANPLPTQTALRGVPFSFTLPTDTFSDADGVEDIVSITANNLSTDMRFDNASQTLFFTPSKDAANTNRLSLVATDSQGKQAVATLDIAVESSLSVLPAPSSQSYLENTVTALILPSISSPSQNNAIVTIQCDPAGGALSLNTTAANITASYQAGVGRLSLNGPLSAIAQPGIVLFTPSTNRYDDVEFNFAVVNDGLNQAAPTSSFSLAGIETYIPIRSGANPVSVAVAPGQTTIISIPTFINPNRKPLSFSAEIYNLEGGLVANESSLQGWQINVDQTLAQISLVPPVGVIGNYEIAITADSGIPGDKATVRGPVRVLGTLQTYQVNNVVSLFENSQANNASLNLFQISYLGSQNATIEISMNSAVGRFAEISVPGISAITSQSNGYATCRLEGPQEGLNQALKSLPLVLATNYNGLGNPLICTINNGLETQGLQLTLNVNPVHHSPTVGDIIQAISLTAGNDFTQSFASTAFRQIHGDPASFSWNATRSDDSSLPSWMQFDSATRTLSGRVPDDFSGELDIKLTVTDSSNDPALPLSARQVSQTLHININPKPAVVNQSVETAKKVLETVGSPVFTILGVGLVIYALQSYANRRLHAEQRKSEKLVKLLKEVHKAHPDIHSHPFDAAAMKRLYTELNNLNEEGPWNREAFQKLELFKQLCSPFICENMDASKAKFIIPSDEWKLLDKVASDCDNLKASILNERGNLEFVMFRAKFIRATLDLLLLTDTLSQVPIKIDRKIGIRQALLSLAEAINKRKTKLDEQPSIMKIKIEIKGALAALSCLLDDDKLLNAALAHRLPIQPKVWYLKLMSAERLAPYVKASNKQALDRILEIYKTVELKKWHVIESAQATLIEALSLRAFDDVSKENIRQVILARIKEVDKAEHLLSPKERRSRAIILSVKNTFEVAVGWQANPLKQAVKLEAESMAKPVQGLAAVKVEGQVAVQFTQNGEDKAPAARALTVAKALARSPYTPDPRSGHVSGNDIAIDKASVGASQGAERVAFNPLRAFTSARALPRHTRGATLSNEVGDDW